MWVRIPPGNLMKLLLIFVLLAKSEILPYEWREPRWATELRQLLNKAIEEDKRKQK